MVSTCPRFTTCATLDPQAIVFGGQIPPVLATMLIERTKIFDHPRYGVHRGGPKRTKADHIGNSHGRSGYRSRHHAFQANVLLSRRQIKLLKSIEPLARSPQFNSLMRSEVDHSFEVIAVVSSLVRT
jgi:hypothetical protein